MYGGLKGPCIYSVGLHPLNPLVTDYLMHFNTLFKVASQIVIIFTQLKYTPLVLLPFYFVSSPPPQQSRDRIINGSHPCTKEEACLFAAYQCQVQLGNHNEAKHKPGFLKLVQYICTDPHSHSYTVVCMCNY